MTKEKPGESCGELRRGRPEGWTFRSAVYAPGYRSTTPNDARQKWNAPKSMLSIVLFPLSVLK